MHLIQIHFSVNKIKNKRYTSFENDLKFNPYVIEFFSRNHLKFFTFFNTNYNLLDFRIELKLQPLIKFY